MPVYYNAWLYDSHHDPLLSLISIIIKSCAGVFDTKLDSVSLKSKFSPLFQAITPFINKTSLAFAAASAGSLLSSSPVDILEYIQTEDEIRECIHKTFDEVISEHADRLVVFIDELDRCKPTFAVEMLEKIKHYFSDDRIIFVVSTNKEQLSHTIKRHYGDEFDATRYLNKFFDLNITLPEIKYPFSDSTEKHCELISITNELINYYRLPLRDILIVLNKISSISHLPIYDSDNYGCRLYSLFTPIIVLLDIQDIQKKKDFLSGESNILDELFDNIEYLQYFAKDFDLSNNRDIEKGVEEIKKAYRYIFSPNNLSNYFNILGIPDNAKERLSLVSEWI